ncbi:MAG: hypothetical protein FJ125_13315, partial [Deltaproteobacteria bacterium]|nr:hypothetical protein [Deltaproteobacteria bacterium]
MARAVVRPFLPGSLVRDPDHRYAMVDNDCDGERDEEGGCERCSEVANAGGSGLDIEFCQIVSADVPHRFWVGSRAEIAWEQDCPGTPWNEPQHEVVFRQAYQLMRFEVTVAQYQTCAAARPGDCPPANRCNPGGGTPNYGVRGKEQQPVVCVDLAMAQGFCRWIGGRLPSEAEW